MDTDNNNAPALSESKRPIDINTPIRYAGLFYTSIKPYQLSDKALFKGTLIPQDRLHDQDYFISFHDFLIFTNNAIRLVGSETVAMDFGQHLVLPAHGTWGLAVMTSPVLFDAIMLFKEYVALELPFFIFHYQETHEHVTVEIKATAAIQERLQFHLGYLLVAEAINFKYALKDNSDLEVHCAYAEPDYGHRYREIIGREVTFNSTFTGVRFKRKHLKEAMPDANHASHKMLMNTLQQARVATQESTSLTSTIAGYLGKEPFCYPSQEAIAEKLNMSARNLRRCLKEENTTYQEIVSNLKKRDAFRCLNDGMSVSQVALELGYEDPSNFTRAFRKWFGVSPSKFCEIRN